MRLGRWLILGAEAGQVINRAGQCGHEQAKRARALRELQRHREALERTKANLREKVEDCEQLKGVLMIVAPDRLAEWKTSRYGPKREKPPSPEA